jgi:hypothetical protein
MRFPRKTWFPTPKKIRILPPKKSFQFHWNNLSHQKSFGKMAIQYPSSPVYLPQETDNEDEYGSYTPNTPTSMDHDEEEEEDNIETWQPKTPTIDPQEEEKVPWQPRTPTMEDQPTGDRFSHDQAHEDISWQPRTPTMDTFDIPEEEDISWHPKTPTSPQVSDL